MLGELPEEHKMEEDLKRYISLNTYIQTENPWFWQRLRYNNACSYKRFPSVTGLPNLYLVID